MRRDPDPRRPPRQPSDPRETPDPNPPSPSPTIPRPPKPVPPEDPPPAATRAVTRVGQAQRRVREALERSPTVSKRLIRVRPEGDRLELHGCVHSFREKLEAQRVALREFPDGISNRLEVDLRAPESDDGLAHETRRALRRSGELDARTVTVEAHGSKVLLRGTTATPRGRRAAADLALGVPGAKEVVNLVRVDDREHQVDRHAAESILDRLRRNGQLRNRRLHVAVSGDTVVLSGRVDSGHEVRLAEEIAGEFPVLRIRNRIAHAS